MADAGYRVAKYVPNGPVREVLPPTLAQVFRARGFVRGRRVSCASSMVHCQ